MTRHPSLESLWTHAAAAALVLVVAVLATRPGVAYLSDEGAAILQARQLSERGTWIYQNPLPRLDPTSEAMPFPRGDAGEKGLAPYARHPLYPRVLQAAHAVAGTSGYVGVSVLGTLLAALGAAALARRVRAVLAVPVLWMVVLSPLFFDSLVVLAHTVGAAAAVGAVLAFLRAVDGPHRGRWLAWGGVFVCTALAGALRTEGVLLALGLAVAGLVVVRRIDLRRAAPPVVLALAGAAAVQLGEGAFRRATLGAGAQGLGVSGDRLGSGRVEGLVGTWLLPGHRPVANAALLLVLGMTALGAGALLVRTGRRDRLPVILVGMGAACYLARMFVGPSGPVPGLLVAFPIGFAAVWLLTRVDVGPLAAGVAAAAAVAVAAGVLATQYPEGGSVEWGGRYFALVVPLAAVPLAAALVRTWSSGDWAPRLRVSAAAGLIVVTLATAGLAAGTVRDVHGLSAQLAGKVERAAATTDPAPAGVGRPGDQRPIVLTTETLVPQLLWPIFDRYRWLVARNERLPVVVERAARAGVRSLVVLTANPTGTLAAIAPWYRATPVAGPPRSVSVYVLDIR